jgi:hypothetical protein
LPATFLIITGEGTWNSAALTPITKIRIANKVYVGAAPIRLAAVAVTKGVKMIK